MTGPGSAAELPCANCGRIIQATDLDDRMWCADCRARLVRRSRLTARVIAFVFTFGMAYWIFSLIGSESRFLVAFIVLIVATYYLLLKVAQRVAFELYRARGIPTRSSR